MHYAVKYLKDKRQSLIEEIRSGKHDKIEDKTEIEKAISWIEKIMELELEHSKSYDFIELPDMNTGYSEYHILNDCGTAEVKDWIEIKDKSGNPITLISGDVLIRSK